MSTRLRLADLLGGLSIVADMGFGLPPETAMRACVIGTGLARKLELPEQDVADTAVGESRIDVVEPAGPEADPEVPTLSYLGAG